jgi:hypothetical protein
MVCSSAPRCSCRGSTCSARLITPSCVDDDGRRDPRELFFQNGKVAIQDANSSTGVSSTAIA